MKKSIIFVFLCALTLTLTAQSLTENIPATSDSSLMIDKIYGGLLNTVAFNTKEATVSGNYSFRVGAKATWQAFSFMKVKTFATFDYTDGNFAAINSFSLRFHDRKEKFGFELGSMATPATESRPLPGTPAGHFETGTEFNIPGGALGAKASIKIGKNNSICAGAFIRNKELEYHFRFGSKFVDVSGFANFTSKEFGGVSVVKANRVYNVTVFKNKVAENLLCNFINVELNKKRDISFYTDFIYQVDTKEIKRLEFGFYKNFSSKLFGGLVCLGYRHENRAICGYLFAFIR